MAQKALKMEVVTPERTVFSDDVESVVVPATQGYLGVLYNHAPMITGLEIGVIKYTKDNKENLMAVTGGFMEVMDNKLVVLADAAELSSEIDVIRAQEAKKRAEQRIETKKEEIDFERAKLALYRALNRIEAAEKD
ncbi:F-type H+-transporting ATPase subunit epsilon [Desulfitispora alkaliphila]|uniref:F0F1 ATP synthase subunit epsilon n=1 Tax=Desulfitispora alkaliphila TaxID=622674 RepID=UPI003D1FD8A4